MTFWLLKLQISKLKTVYRMFEHFHKRKLSLGGGYVFRICFLTLLDNDNEK